jgi:hypothetical protein
VVVGPQVAANSLSQPPCLGQPLGRWMTSRRAVAKASVTIRAAPRAELVPPYAAGSRQLPARRWGRDDGDQRVKALDAGVPVPGALLGITVDGLDRVVDIDGARLFGAERYRCVAGQCGQDREATASS